MARDIREFKQFALQKNPNMSKSQLGELDSFINQRLATEAVESGKLKLSDIPMEDRVGVASGLPEGYKAGGDKPSLKGTPANQMNFLKDILDAAGAAESGHKKEYTGLWNALQGLGRIKTGAKGAREEVKFRQNVADARTAIRKYISGAAISDAEAGEFKDLIPKVSDSDEEILGKFAGLQEISKRKATNVLETAGFDVNIEDYLGLGQKTTPTTPTELSPEDEELIKKYGRK